MPEQIELEEKRRRRKILKDGEVFRAPVIARDAQTTEHEAFDYEVMGGRIHARRGKDGKMHTITDGRERPKLNQPGYRYGSNKEAQDGEREAWEERNRRLEDAWKAPHREKQELQAANRQADAEAAARLANPQRTQDQSVKDRAWEARNRRLQDAWRS